MDMMGVLCGAMLAALLLFPAQSADAAREALAVWGLDVVPSLFPYMALCRALCARLAGTRLPATRIACLLGLLGGSPSGAAAVSSGAARRGLTRGSLLSLAALTGTLSPMFFLSTVRGWLGGGATLAWLLALSHLAGALFAFAAVRLRMGRDGAPLPPAADADGGAASPIAQSVSAILNVGGCIVVFSVVSCMVSRLLPGLPAGVCAALHAALEIAGGTRALLAAPMSPRGRAVLLAAASGFSGLSVLSQNLLFYKPLGVGMRELALLALLRACGCAVAMACFTAVIPL